MITEIMDDENSHTSIRPAAPFDADAIARVHMRSWRESYAGIIPDAELQRVSVAERAQRWRHILTLPSGDEAVFVAMRENAVAGFGDCGRQRSRELPFAGEFNAIYLAKEVQRAGIGRALMAALADHLLACNMTSASVWVLKENMQARRFYEALGGRAVAEKQEPRKGYVLQEVAYGWESLEKLRGE